MRGGAQYVWLASDAWVRMIRFLFRLLSMVALATAVIMAVLDATRSIAASALILTPLATSWGAVSPDTLAGARELVATKLHPLVWDLLIAPVISLPGFVVFAALAFLCFAIGRRPERHVGHLSI